MNKIFYFPPLNPAEEDVLKDSPHGCDIIHNPLGRKLFTSKVSTCQENSSIFKILHSLPDILPIFTLNF